MKVWTKVIPALVLTAACLSTRVSADDTESAKAAGAEYATVVSSGTPQVAPHVNIGVPATVAREVFGGGGTTSASQNFRLNATIGETLVGPTAGAATGLSQGFWQDFGGSCCALRADINHDGTGPDIADLIYFVSYVFQGGPNPTCGAELDVNGDGRPIPDISDIVYLVSFMFSGGVAPLPCAG